MVEYLLTPLEPNKTSISWTMSGKNNFIGRFFCFFMNMDDMVGKDFEKGLSQMKSFVEKQPRP